MAYELIAPPKITYKGNEDLASRFRYAALRAISNLKIEAELNKLPYLSRSIEVIPGFVISAELNYGQQAASVFIDKAIPEEELLAVLGIDESFYVISIEEIVENIDPSFGSGTTNKSYKVKWVGGKGPFTCQVNSWELETVEFYNVDTDMYTLIPDREFTVSKFEYTDPWGSVDAHDSTENSHVGLVIVDKEFRRLFAAFSGNDGSFGLMYHGRFYTFGKFNAYGPPAINTFDLTATVKDAGMLKWTGGISPFFALLANVAYTAGNWDFTFLDGNNRKRQVALVNVGSTAYWAALDGNAGTSELRVEIYDSFGNIGVIPFDQLTGNKPTYIALSSISSENISSVPTAKCHYGMGTYTTSLVGTFNAKFTVSGNYDQYTITMQPIDSSKYWGYFDGGSIMVIDDLSSLNFFFNPTFGPPLYHYMTFSRQALSPTKTSTTGSVATTASITVTTGGVGPYYAELINYPGGSGVSIVDNFVNIGEYSDSNRPKFTLMYGNGNSVFTIGTTFQLKISDGAGQVSYVNINSPASPTFTTPYYTDMVVNWHANEVYGSGNYSGYHAAAYDGSATYSYLTSPPTSPPKVALKTKFVRGKTVKYHTVPVVVVEYITWVSADGDAPNNKVTRTLKYSYTPLAGSPLSTVNTAMGIDFQESDFWVQESRYDTGLTTPLTQYTIVQQQTRIYSVT